MAGRLSGSSGNGKEKQDSPGDWARAGRPGCRVVSRERERQGETRQGAEAVGGGAGAVHRLLGSLIHTLRIQGEART